ncbi:MAG: hypothetical protein H0W96_03630, partial [Solirubrobacterales bacterium]|nr:hypothetical protein [Solirubrobacterales bacterium]
MITATSFLRDARRCLVPAVVSLVLAPAVCAAAGPWTVEPIRGSEGVRDLHDLSFDAAGRALLGWDAELIGRVPPTFGGLA